MDATNIRDGLFFIADPATFGLVVLSLMAIIFGAYQSRALYFHGTEENEDSEQVRSQPPLLATSSSVIKKRTAILLPIMGSIILVILFYWLKKIYYLLLIILISCSLFALCFIQWPFATYIIKVIRARFPRFPATILFFRFMGRTPVEIFLVSPLTITLGVLYFVYNHWVILDIFSLSIVAFSLSVLRVTNLKIAMVMLTFFFLYDMFWVFGSSLIFKQNVMVVVATNLATSFSYRLPMAIQIPTVFQDHVNLLGLGDIILPGFFLCFLYRFDMGIQGHAWQGYFLNACIGYTVGLLLALIMMVSMAGLAQPALTYLVPCTIIPTLVLGYARKDLKNLWTGSTGRLHTLRSSSSIIEDVVEEDGVSIQLDVLSEEDQNILDENEDGIEMEVI